MNSRHASTIALLTALLAAGFLLTTGQKVTHPEAVKSEPSARKSVSALPQTLTSVTVPTFQISPDALPRSHRQLVGHTAKRKPLRSGEVDLPADWMDTAMVGGAFSFDLGAGLIAEGEFVVVAHEAMPGVISWAGVLHNPPGKFQIEHHSRGWGAIFKLTDRQEVVQFIPDRHQPGVTHLEVWPVKETVCAGADDDGSPITAPPADPSIDHLNLQSRPGAENVIYLDFNGETVSGTSWNNLENSFNDIVAAPSGFNRDEIVATWARAAEDWVTFDVNVTTNRAVYNDKEWHSRVMVISTPTKQWYTEGESGIGGVAWHDSFNNLALSSICWSWNLDNYLECAETISHECGHTMGNSHSSWESGSIEEEYYEGHETLCGVRWAPIMGWSPTAGLNGLTQFSNGDYSGSSNSEDQIDEIEFELGAVGDENSTLQPEFFTMITDFKRLKGLMNSGGDVDSYICNFPAGGWEILIEPNPCGPNFDVRAAIRNYPSDSLVQRASNESGAGFTLSARLIVPETGGFFRINIASDACNYTPGDSSSGEYSNYGGIGSYKMTVRRPADFESNAPVIASVIMSGLKQGTETAEAEITFRDASEIETYFPSGSGAATVTLERLSGGVSVTGYKVGGTVHTTDDSGNSPVHKATRKFRFSAPGGYWDAAEVGSYRIRVTAGAAIDEWGNVSAPTTTSVSSLAADTTPPVVTANVSPANVVDGSVEWVRIDVSITDESPIVLTQNGANALEAVSSSGAANITPLRSTVTSANGGRQKSIIYYVVPPGARWDDSEAGVWNVQVITGKVSDTLGNVRATSLLGKFSVTGSLFFQDFDVTAGTTGFTFDEGWEHGPPQGTSPFFDDPTEAASGSRCLGYELAGATRYANNLPERYATTPLIDTVGHEGLTLRYRRWLTRYAGDGARIEVNDASTDDAWQVLWQAPVDSWSLDDSWVWHELPIPAKFANSALRVRWVMGTTDANNTAGGWNIDDVEVLAAGTYQSASLVMSLPPFFILQEDGTSLSYTVRLNQSPFFPVTVTIQDGADLTSTASTLTFHNNNWSIPQTVTVTAVNDNNAEGTESMKIRLLCTSLDTAFSGVRRDVGVSVVDNDTSIIADQPDDAAVLPGDSARLEIELVPIVGASTITWYEGLRGGRATELASRDDKSILVQLDAKATRPQYYFARVTGNGKSEDSRQVIVEPLTGLAAFRARLRGRGYTEAQVFAPTFLTSDPDHNGLTHLAEYALGRFPGDAPRWFLSMEVVPALSGILGELDLMITLPRLQSDVTYALESSSDAQLWNTVVELEGSDYGEAPVMVRIPGGGSDKLLARLRVWQPF